MNMTKKELKKIIRESISEVISENDDGQHEVTDSENDDGQHEVTDSENDDGQHEVTDSENDDGQHEVTENGRADGESPVDYVEYSKDIEGEPRFKMGNKDFQYVWAKYPNGKTDIGVYSFGEDRVYGYEFFRKMYNIQ